MKFCEITEDQYRKFWEKSSQRFFLSAPEILKVNAGDDHYFLAVLEKEKIVAACMVRGTKSFMGWTNFYAPRGILVDYGDQKLLQFFVKNLREFLRGKNGFVLHIDPYVERVERDIDGKIVEGGYDNSEYVENLKSVGFLKTKYVPDVSQITWEFVLPVAGKTTDDVLGNMKSSTKRALLAAESLGIEVRTLKRDELGDFYGVLDATAKRKSFGARDLAYFERMYDSFGDDVRFLTAVLNPKKCLEDLKELKKKIEAGENIEGKNKNQLKDLSKSTEAKIEKIGKIFAVAEDREVIVACGMFLTVQPEVLYLAGGSPDNLIKLGGQYVLQWEMIKYAIKNGFEVYNFYGILPDIEHHQNDGVYEFKKGFSGKVVELIGEFEFPLNKFKYQTVKILSSIKKLF